MPEAFNPALEVPDTFNLAEALVDRNIEKGRGGKEAVIFRDKVFTYSQIQELTNKAGNLLKKVGAEREDRVALILYDSHFFVAAFFGAIKIGAVSVPVSTLLNPHEYIYILNDCRAKILFVSEELAPKIEEIRSSLEYLEHILTINENDDDFDVASLGIDSLSNELQVEKTSKDEPALWQYTSGTTGKPKGVVHLQHDMVYCAHLYGMGVLDLTEKDRTFSIAKLSYGYGLGNSLYCPFWAGSATILFPGRPLPEQVAQFVDTYKPTVYSGVPTSYAAILENKELTKKYKWDSIRIFFSAGEALPPQTFLKWKEITGKEIVNGIGATEAGHIFVSNSLSDNKPGSAGRIVPGYDVKLVDNDLQEVPVGEPGRVMVKGDSVAAYYWNRHEDTKKTYLGEWLLTGDMMSCDAEGYYTFIGRADDMIKAGGLWVAPTEVEDVLLQHEAVLECGVIDSPDKEGLRKPKAFVVLYDRYEPSKELEDELKRFVKDRIAPFKYPRWIQFIPEVPKSATGKLQRFKLRELDKEN